MATNYGAKSGYPTICCTGIPKAKNIAMLMSTLIAAMIVFNV